ncbi:MAG: hypothetical protein EXR93_05235 [Gemmatimonadetes bacterium]|nr:hypothetical protein [Gemmatimonadota bacterium]
MRATILFLGACRPASSAPPVVTPALFSSARSPVVAAHLPAYFGYYGDGFTWLSSTTAEVAGHVNVSWVSSDIANTPALLAKVADAHRLGLKVALAIPADVFWAADMTLATDYAGKWKTFADQVRPNISDVAFLYAVDEPYLQAKGAKTSAADMKVRLETVSLLIKQTFPGVPVAFTFTAMDFEPRKSAFADLDNPLPANYDYFGFDCYGSWDRCGRKQSAHPIPWFVDQIKAKLSANQKIFIFADAFVRQGRGRRANAGQDTVEAVLRVARADQYYQLVLSDSSIVGLFPFLYQDDYVEAGQRFFGVKHWPALQARYVEIGRQITGK